MAPPLPARPGSRSPPKPARFLVARFHQHVPPHVHSALPRLRRPTTPVLLGPSSAHAVALPGASFLSLSSVAHTCWRWCSLKTGTICFVVLFVPGLSYSTQDLQSLLWQERSLVAACELLTGTLRSNHTSNSLTRGQQELPALGTQSLEPLDHQGRPCSVPYCSYSPGFQHNSSYPLGAHKIFI